MKYLELAFPDPARNLACDEALLALFENEQQDELLRLWEPSCHFVVLGYSNKLSSEVDLVACEARGIPIYRRISGGGTVLQGPGCLNYSLILRNPQMSTGGGIAEIYQYVLTRHQKWLGQVVAEKITLQGVSDLAITNRKFSGNAQHRKRKYSLVHGTFLFAFDLSLAQSCLRVPSRQPAYRENRLHGDFLRNLFIDPKRLRQVLRREWKADEVFTAVPQGRIEELVRERYGRDEWNLKFL